MKDILIPLIVFLICDFYVLYDVYKSIEHDNFSKNCAYNKNLIDWIVYILAWIVTPFSIFSVHLITAVYKYRWELEKLFSYKNWEEIRRLNLYFFIFFSTIIGLIFLSVKTSDYFEEFTLLFYLIFVVFSFCILGGIWKLIKEYEKHIESKLFIPGSDIPAPKLKKEYIERVYRKRA